MSQFDWLFEEDFSAGQNLRNTRMLKQLIGEHLIYWRIAVRLPQSFDRGLLPQEGLRNISFANDNIEFVSMQGQQRKYFRSNKMECHRGEIRYTASPVPGPMMNSCPLAGQLYLSSGENPTISLSYSGSTIADGVIFSSEEAFQKCKKEWLDERLQLLRCQTNDNHAGNWNIFLKIRGNDHRNLPTPILCFPSKKNEIQLIVMNEKIVFSFEPEKLGYLKWEFRNNPFQFVIEHEDNFLLCSLLQKDILSWQGVISLKQFIMPRTYVSSNTSNSNEMEISSILDSYQGKVRDVERFNKALDYLGQLSATDLSDLSVPMLIDFGFHPMDASDLFHHLKGYLE